MPDPISLDEFRNRLPERALQPGGGDGTSDGMEARVAALEAHFEHIRDDVRDIKGDIRLILGVLGSGFLVLAGMMIAGYLRLSDAIAILAHH